MDIFDKIGRFFGIIDDYEEKDTEKKEPEPVKTPPPKETTEPPKSEFAAANVVSFNSAASNKEISSARPIKLVKSEIKTIKPQKADDAKIIADYLRDKIPIIMNFEETDPEIADQIVYFVSGTVYAINGTINSAGEKVLICAPENVKVQSYEDEKKSKGTFID